MDVRIYCLPERKVTLSGSIAKGKRALTIVLICIWESSKRAPVLAKHSEKGLEEREKA